jgi:hypothetical protein
MVKSPTVFWQSTDVRQLVFEAAFTTPATTARLSWRKPGDPDFLPVPERTLDFPIIGDGVYRTYRVNLAGEAGWEGIISQIGLESTPGTPTGSSPLLRMKSVTMGN